MPFDPNFPANDAEMHGSEFRNQFNSLHEEAIATETDPVFAASEAAKLGAGDKAKPDRVLQPGTNRHKCGMQAGGQLADKDPRKFACLLPVSRGYVPSR